MKQLLTLLLIVQVAGMGLAQVPHQMKYQAVARDASGEIMAGETVNIQLSLLQSSAEGSAVFIEQHSLTTTATGLLSLDIGSGTILTGSLASIDWANGPYFLRVEMNGTLMGTSQLMTVPYAYYAHRAAAYNEEDPQFASALASNITAADTAYWNQKQEVSHARQTIDSLNAVIDNLRLATGKASVTDYDGNRYPVTQIGNQVWMARNLRTTHYADGTEIPHVAGNTEWADLEDNNSDKAYSFFDNDKNVTQGALYTWAAVMNGASGSETNPSGVQGICPDGWHVPSKAEWEELESYLTAAGYAGMEAAALRSTIGWSDDLAGLDDYEMAVVPTGFRDEADGQFMEQWGTAHFWTATEGTSSARAYFFFPSGSNQQLLAYNNDKSYGLAVRCVKN